MPEVPRLRRHIPLDFSAKGSVAVRTGKTRMSHSNMVTAKLITEIEAQLAEGHSIAKAARACAVDGQVGRAVTISLGIEDADALS